MVVAGGVDVDCGAFRIMSKILIVCIRCIGMWIIRTLIVWLNTNPRISRTSNLSI